MADQCALRADGTIKDASEITFYNDAGDTTPISGPASLQNITLPDFPVAENTPEGRGHRKKSTAKLNASLRAEQENEDGLLIKPKPRGARRTTKKQPTHEVNHAPNIGEPILLDAVMEILRMTMTRLSLG
ncbi:hypothetical protein BC835DRAFT_1527571 [Cytidiella melzeri]|nr:hypothetical protein BC835DRAFT_1527571 [Cytidiella melzeri]